MVLVTAGVFLTQLLCLLVPCDPKYQLPDVSPVPHAIHHPHPIDQHHDIDFKFELSSPTTKTEERISTSISERKIKITSTLNSTTSSKRIPSPSAFPSRNVIPSSAIILEKSASSNGITNNKTRFKVDKISDKQDDYNDDETSAHDALPSFLNAQELKPDLHVMRDCEDEYPFARTEVGHVMGYRMKVTGGRKICVFEGIPYAEPPVGFLRFRSPVPKGPWRETLKATQFAPPCLQYNVPEVFRTLGKEDCLYLNIYGVPNPHKLLPVIVYIHGGGFFFGSARTYGPAYLLQKDVILVTIQYRLGVLGFLSTGDHVCPGNQGLKDQALALKWVHDNIHAFGGNRDKVTILGQSAGSASVHLHMLSHSSRPYFQRAVSMSGTALNYWSHYDQIQTRNLTNVFADLAGCPNEDSEKMMDCLAEKNPVDLVSLTPPFLDDWPNPQNAFRPSVEVIEDNPDPFLTDLPENLYARGEVYKIPWIVSTVSGEGYAFLLYPFIAMQIPVLQRNWVDLALDLVDAENIDVDPDRVLKKLTNFYFKKVPPEKASIHQFAQIVTDRSFLYGIYQAAKAHTQVAPTYSYLFDFNGQYNFITNFGYAPSEWGVQHTEDLFYLFNSTSIYRGFQRGQLEFDISSFLVNLITNFADKGEPLYTTESGDIRIWHPHPDHEHLNFLGISKYIGMIGDPFKGRIKFWNSMDFPDSPHDVIVTG